MEDFSFGSAFVNESVYACERVWLAKHLQVVLVVGEQSLRALGPQRLHRVLALALVIPLEEAHERLVGLAGLVLIGLILLDDTHHVRHIGFPAAFGKSEGRLLGASAIALKALAATLLRRARSR